MKSVSDKTIIDGVVDVEVSETYAPTLTIGVYGGRKISIYPETLKAILDWYNDRETKLKGGEHDEQE